MKKMITLLAFTPLMAFAASSTPAGFTDNLDAALAAAKENGKYVYACFSGSDWCHWCKKLDQEVFAHAAFVDAVTNDYELVFIDSPSNREFLSEHAKAENDKLTKKYDIKGFPTALVLTGDGEQVAQTGYRQGGPNLYAMYLMDLRKDGPALLKKEAAQRAYVGPFKDRQRKIMDDLRTEIMAVQKKPVAEAAAKIDTLIGEFEAVPTPEGLDELRAEFLKELRGMLKMMKRED